LSRAHAAHHWLRQSNPRAASKVLELLARYGSNRPADEMAARILGVAQQRGLRIDEASLTYVARMATLPQRLSALAAPTGGSGAVSTNEIDALRALAREHAAVMRGRDPSQPNPPSQTVLQITRVPPLPSPVRPPRPADNEPITQIAAYVRAEPTGSEVLNLAGRDLRGVPNLAAQINALQRERVPVPIDLSNANLSGLDLQGVDLSRAQLQGANLQRTILTGANLHAANLRGADLSRATLVGATLTANLDRATLVGADMTDAYLNGAGLRGADLSNAKMLGASLYETDLSRASLTGADLTDAYMPKAQLPGGQLEGATLVRANLYRVDLQDAHLSGANLQGANLNEARLNRADLSAANLTQALLSNADLSEANLTRAQFDGAQLRGALLDGSNQTGVDWSRALNVNAAPTRGSVSPPDASGQPPARVTPTTVARADPKAQGEVIQRLMARYNAPSEVRTQRMVQVILAEADRTRRSELESYQRTGEPPADVRDGRSTETQFLGRTASLGNYLRYLEQNPERFQAIADRTIYAESQYLTLASEARNAGALRTPQIETIKQQNDPLRQAYLTYRALSTALRNLDADWTVRAEGRARTTVPPGYADSLAYLNDLSADTSQPLTALMQSEWGPRLPLGRADEGERRMLSTKQRVLDVVNKIETRLSLMARPSPTDAASQRESLADSLRTLDALIAELQGMASEGRGAGSVALSVEQAEQGLRIVQPLRDRVHSLLGEQ
jgi:uncharacterized protein YjbI with pentapeptide repeats